MHVSGTVAPSRGFFSLRSEEDDMENRKKNRLRLHYRYHMSKVILLEALSGPKGHVRKLVLVISPIPDF